MEPGSTGDNGPRPSTLGRWWPVLSGVVFFTWYAATEPIFGSYLIDVPLYLALALAGIALFLLVLCGLRSRDRIEEIARGEELTRTDWGAYGAAMLIAAIAVVAAARVLAATI